MRRIYRCAVAIVVLVVACSDFGPTPFRGASRRLLVGERAVCALDANDTVYCWGANTNRWEYGVAPEVLGPSGVPVPVPVLSLASLAAGVGSHFCGIDHGSRAVCWGRGGFGQLGAGVLGDSGNAPQPVRGIVRWSDLWIGRLNTCGVSDDRRGFCWGANQHGEIGVGEVSLEERTWSPIELDGGLRFIQVIPGWYHSCGITTDTATYCWGGNDFGQLGVGAPDLDDHVAPVRVSGNFKFVQLALGASYTCGITSDGTPYCWGANTTGQLGEGTAQDRFSPTFVNTNQKFVSIATSSGFAGGSNAALPSGLIGVVGHTCGLNAAGQAYCWGWNANGQLGDGTTIDRNFPVPVSGGLSFSTIGLGGSSTCGMQGNAVWCWGANALGQLGVSASARDPVPVPTRVQAPF